MKRIYEGVAKLIQDNVFEIAWIDQDTGQLEYYTLRPGLDFPAALIDVSYTDCQNNGAGQEQRCTVEINVRLVFEVWSEANMAAPESVRDLALSFYDIIDKVRLALHARKIATGEVLYRTSVRPERREDGLKVFNMSFRCKTTEK
ncbi:MAG: hypothetical protein BGO30_07320 [Bacteroidetes bacterium 41-46]|nr:MAG: hypothetical protein BGO30_07320 [Bacteroidetes bacterium 41-46]